MRVCTICDGPTAACPHCHHAHCDDDSCPGMPLACAQAVSADPGAGRW